MAKRARAPAALSRCTADLTGVRLPPQRANAAMWMFRMATPSGERSLEAAPWEKSD
jgi:hypothetical protein